MKRHTAPIIAAILLLLPVLYVGSYFALVVPAGRYVRLPREPGTARGHTLRRFSTYRLPIAAAIYWPLEQIDRRVRPGAWQPGIELRHFSGGGFGEPVSP